MQGTIWGISLQDGSEVVNNHFVDDSLLLVRLDQILVETTRGCFDVFCSASRVVVTKRNVDYCLVGLDDPITWIPDLGQA